MTLPGYNTPGETKGLYCDLHKKPGMVDVKNKKCLEANCRTQPCYNNPGETKGLYCDIHKKEGMIDVKNKKCLEPGCKTIPSYNVAGNPKGIYCNQHKKEGMINVKDRRCLESGCTKVPNFNTPGEKRGLYCDIHKKEGMVNVKRKRCIHPACITSAAFNMPGQTKGLYCDQHKKEGMINVVSKRCIVKECKTIARFNMPGQTKGVYCNVHKNSGMIDVMANRCTDPNCTTTARYGMPGQKATCCAKHKTQGMIAYPKRKCEVCKKASAIYGLGNIPTHCEQHHDSACHVNLVHKDCKTCMVLEIVDKEGNCSRCSDYLKRHLCCRKQRQIKNMLLAHSGMIPKFDSYDRIIDNGACGKERPDFYWQTQTHVVVLEVDEHQHKERACECEQTRMVNITSSFGMPTFWIRYNPDDFKGQWSKLTENIRHDELRRMILHCINSPPVNARDFCRVIYMYFDGFKRTCVQDIDRIPIL